MAARPLRVNGNKFKAVCTIGLLLQSVSALCAADLATGMRVPDRATTKCILDVLPDYTEGVVVSGPYRYVPPTMPKPIGYQNGQPLFAPEDSSRTVTLESEAFRCNTSFFDEQPQLRQFCRAQEFELTLVAFRTGRTEFEIPGGTKVDSVQIVVSKTDVPSNVREMFRQTKNSSAGFPVLQFAPESRLTGTGRPPLGFVPAKEPKVKYFYALPSSRILVATTSEELLRDVLQGFAKPPVRVNGFQVPNRFPGSHVTVWALRRLSPTFFLKDDPEAKSFLVGYDSENCSLNFQLQSPSTQSEQALSRAIAAITGNKAISQRINNETVQVSIPNADGRSWAIVYPLLGIFIFV